MDFPPTLLAPADDLAENAELDGALVEIVLVEREYVLEAGCRREVAGVVK